MTEISRNSSRDTSPSFPKEIFYTVFAIAAGCITYGAYQRGQLDSTINTTKNLWTEMVTSKPHAKLPLKPACEDAEAWNPQP